MSNRIPDDLAPRLDITRVDGEITDVSKVTPLGKATIRTGKWTAIDATVEASVPLIKDGVAVDFESQVKRFKGVREIPLDE